MRVVMKFGGSCLNSDEDIRRTVRIVREHGRPVVVLSALKGVTDELIAQEKAALAGGFDLDKIEDIHRRALSGLKPETQVKANNRIHGKIEELRKLYTAVSYLGEITPAQHDRIVSFGERTVIEIAAAYFNEAGLPAVPLWGAEAGIVTNDHFGDAVILEESAELVRQKLPHDKVPVVAGFVGVTKENQITTLGRGGSDYTATFIAAALGSACILWKDVDGLMTADPKIVPEARVVKKMNYLDAMEIAHYGSKVIQEKSILPAMIHKVPIHIRNVNEKGEGTLISQEVGDSMVVSTVKNVAIIDLLGYTGMLDVLSRVLQELARDGIYPLLITESSACGEVSIVVEEGKAGRIEKAAKVLMAGKKMTVDRGLGMVSIIGSVMRGRVGTAAAVFDCLAEERINIITISQSASERSISVVIEGDKVQKAAQALHRKFVK
ncbi:MAG: aspartate kinase [Candidatus Micrarchaeia archaeon]